MAMAFCLAACSASLQDQSYLQQYGYQGGRGQGFRASPYRTSQEIHTCAPGKISGRISRLRAETFSPDMEPGMGMDVQTPDRGLVHIHLGPLWFLDRQKADLKPGDEVTLQAFCYNLAGEERLLASEITHKGNTLKLQDVQGKPYWEDWRKE
jgi:GH24 family phage-related lysozyme (muramidase)